MDRTDATGHPAPDGLGGLPGASPAPLPCISMDALCPDTIGAYRRALADAQDDHSWLNLPTEELLLRLNAASRMPGSDAIVPTEAGLLMFGYEHEIARVFPGYLLDFREVSDSGAITRRIISNNGRWSGSVYGFWERVAPLVAPPGSDGDSPLGEAAREGLANALVHADYRGRRHVVVVKGPDRIEYANPGRLRVRRGAAFEGGVSDPRNPTLMKMFFLIGACTDAGSGLCMIRQACEETGIPDPVLCEQAAPDRTTLSLFVGAEGEGPAARSADAGRGLRGERPAPALHDLFSIADGKEDPPAAAPTELAQHHAAAPRGQLGEDEAAVRSAQARAGDEDARVVLGLFRGKRRIRRTDVEDALGIGSTKAKSVVASLVAEGAIEPVGGGRSTYYRLVRV